MVNKIIAVIPARGGSKRLPMKNIKPLEGKPMLGWTIDAAIRSGCFTQIVVSTDDKIIAKVAESFGVKVPFLRDRAADDLTPVSEATIYAVKQAEAYWQCSYDIVVQLMPNCPLCSSDDIKTALHNFKSKGVEHQISCFKFGWMNPWWAATIDDNGHPKRLFPEVKNKRSQDLNKLYCPTGAIWISKRNALMNSGTFYGPKHIYWEMDWTHSVDIDDEDDFKMAKILIKLNNTEQIEKDI